MESEQKVRILPAVDQRVESGPIQFGNDWPGVFFRGDDAIPTSWAINMILERFGDQMEPLMERLPLEALARSLGSCDVHRDRAERMEVIPEESVNG